MFTVVFILVCSIALSVLLFAVFSFHEKELRAALLAALFLFVLILTGWLLLEFKEKTWMPVFSVVLITGFSLFAIVSMIRFFPQTEFQFKPPATQFDERDHMFSRNNLQFHPDLASRYYRQHPEKEAVDRKIHAKPELGESGQTFHDPIVSPVFCAAEEFLLRIRDAASGQTHTRSKNIQPTLLYQTIKDLCYFYGAADVGIGKLHSHHWYSHSGRHAHHHGEKIESKHTTAITIIVKMEIRMMKHAPSLPAVLESTRQYVESAKIAMILANYIRRMGFHARAHTDANYQTLCVPIAVECGLGELGRMGIFMHPRFGPCVRISIVTTDLPLPDTVTKRYFIREFCKICKKCAHNCPSKAIPEGDEPSSRGFQHWSIKQENCYSYWKTIGTDCGFCIRSCPYTKADTLPHRLVRFYISRNSLNQRLALFFDNVFYGRKPAILIQNPGVLLGREGKKGK